ncbi:hypothetical protein EV356DRAFT_537742 [Viridothelium virens]|uniref:C2H2-type domain-containing protein n=1 Tax=Viridothelium virens TaxID=1048519 RepID=A0A6A6GSS9_VIRVR|nr:hypothetical protein EV356DRAFT_537742 [Viridothelium virens]
MNMNNDIQESSFDPRYSSADAELDFQSRFQACAMEFTYSQPEHQCWTPPLLNLLDNSSEASLGGFPGPEEVFDLSSRESSRSSTFLLHQSSNPVGQEFTCPNDTPDESYYTASTSELQPNDNTIAFDRRSSTSSSDDGQGEVQDLTTALLRCPYDCEGKTFRRLAEQRRHLVEQHQCSHKDCNKQTFRTSIERDEHEKCHGPFEIGYHCGSCLINGKYRWFRREEKIKKHFKSIHSVSDLSCYGRFQCQDRSCGFGGNGGLFFTSALDLQRHVWEKHAYHRNESWEFMWGEANHESLHLLRETSDEQDLFTNQDLFTHHKKHSNDNGSESSPKRRKAVFHEHSSPTLCNDSTDSTTVMSSQTAEPRDFRNAIVTARQSTSLPNHKPQTWQFETTLVDSIRVGDICSLLGHIELPKIMGELRRLKVSAVFIRTKGAIHLRGAQSFDDLKSATALLEPLLAPVRPLLSSVKSDTDDIGPRGHRRIDRKFRPKQRKKNPTDSIEILSIDRTEDKDAIITWEKFIDPQLSDISRRAGIDDSYTAALIRQKDAHNDPVPVIRFQSMPQADVTRHIIRKSIKKICSENRRPELPIYFYNGTMKTLVGGSFNDDPPDELIVPHQSRYYRRPGMSASIGTSRCEHFYATFGGYILVGGEPFMLTVRHFINEAYACRECTGPKAFDDNICSPALFDIEQLGQVFDELLRTFNLQIENSEAVPAEDEVNLSALVETVPRDQLVLVSHYKRWREDLNREREDFKLGKLVKSSAEDAYAAPFYPRMNDGNVKLHCMDWAIFEVDKERLGKNRFRYPKGIEPNCQHFEREAGSPEGIGESCEASREFRPGEMVYYVGSNSGYREGTINQLPISCKQQDGTETHEWSIIPCGQDDVEVDDVQGDSGAWIIAKSDDHLLGLLWAFNGRLIFFTPIREVFKQIGLKMDDAHVQVAPLGSKPAAPLVLTRVSGNQRRLRTKRRALRNGGCAKRPFGEEQARAKTKHYPTIGGGIWSSNESTAVPRTTMFRRAMSRSPSPVPSLTSSDASLSDSQPSNPPSPGIRSYGLPPAACNLAGKLEKLNIHPQPIACTSPPSLDWTDCHSRLSLRHVLVEA